MAEIRDYLAAERTFLAWVRTGLALMGFGFVVARFGLFLQEFLAIDRTVSTPSLGVSLWFGVGLIITGLAVNVFASWQHVKLVRELDRGGTMPRRSPTIAVVIALFLALVGLAMTVYLVSIRHSVVPHVLNKAAFITKASEKGQGHVRDYVTPAVPIVRSLHRSNLQRPLPCSPS